MGDIREEPTTYNVQITDPNGLVLELSAPKPRGPKSSAIHAMITSAAVSLHVSSPAADSLASLVIDHPFADREPLLHTIEETVTAGAARVGAQAIAQSLRALGVAPGNAVAVQLPNSPETVITMIGVWLAGAVFVPLNARATASETAKIIEATDRRPW